jgi:integrase
MGQSLRPLIAKPRHPVTGKRMTVRGKNRREIEASLRKVAEVREERRIHQQLGLPLEERKHERSLRELAGKAVTLAQAIESYASLSRLSPGTQRRARGIISTELRWHRGIQKRGALADLAGERLEALTPPKLARHFRALSDRAAWATVDLAFHMLTAVARHAAEQGWLVHKPWGMWRPVKPTHPKRRPMREACRSASERAALLRAAAELGLSLEEQCALACGLFLGARRGELCGLEQGDIEHHEEADEQGVWRVGVRVRIVRQYAGAKLKRGELRTVDAGPELAELLAQLAESRPASIRRLKTYPLFPNDKGEHRPNHDCVSSEHLQSAAARAGLGDPKRWTLHSLRDSFCTIEAQACGGDFRKLMERTGHRSFDSVARYLRPFEREAPRLPPGAAPPTT